MFIIYKKNKANQKSNREGLKGDKKTKNWNTIDETQEDAQRNTTKREKGAQKINR